MYVTIRDQLSIVRCISGIFHHLPPSSLFVFNICGLNSFIICDLKNVLVLKVQNACYQKTWENLRSLQGAFEQPEVTTIPNAICANWSYNQLFQGKDKQKKSKWLSKVVDCTPVGCGRIGQYIPSYKIENLKLFQFKLRQDYNC